MAYKATTFKFTTMAHKEQFGRIGKNWLPACLCTGFEFYLVA